MTLFDKQHWDKELCRKVVGRSIHQASTRSRSVESRAHCAGPDPVQEQRGPIRESRCHRAGPRVPEPPRHWCPLAPGCARSFSPSSSCHRPRASASSVSSSVPTDPESRRIHAPGQSICDPQTFFAFAHLLRVASPPPRALVDLSAILVIRVSVLVLVRIIHTLERSLFSSRRNCFSSVFSPFFFLFSFGILRNTPRAI